MAPRHVVRWIRRFIGAETETPVIYAAPGGPVISMAELYGMMVDRSRLIQVEQHGV